MRIWTGLERPVVRAAEILAPAGGIMDLRQFIRSASFQQQNVDGRVLGEPSRDDRTRGAGPADDEVMTLAKRARELSGWLRPALQIRCSDRRSRIRIFLFAWPLPLRRAQPCQATTVVALRAFSWLGGLGPVLIIGLVKQACPDHRKNRRS